MTNVPHTHQRIDHYIWSPSNILITNSDRVITMPIATYEQISNITDH